MTSKECEMGMYGACSKMCVMFNVKGKVIPLQARTGPEGSRKVRPPDFKTIGT